jgi:hypothetical protein
MTDTFRSNSVDSVKDRYYGFMQTIWTSAENFLDQYYSDDPEVANSGQVASLKQIMHHYKAIQ